MLLQHLLLPGLLALTAASSGCQQVSAEDPTPAAAVVYVRVLEVYAGGYGLIAQTTPAPDAIFSVITPAPNLVAGQTLTCEPLTEGTLHCENTIIDYAGCFAPEAIEQPPVQHASLLR